MRKHTRYTGTHGLGEGKARSHYAEKVYPGKGANLATEMSCRGWSTGTTPAHSLHAE